MEAGRLTRLQEQAIYLGAAVGFLTTLPVPARALGADLTRAAGWFPAVGLLLGILLAGSHLALGSVLPPLVAATGVVAIWAALTGALHLDGLADCCDGLLPPVGRERRLEILRDPRLGAFGVVGLTLFVVGKIGVVAALPGGSGWALLLGPVWARWLLLWAARLPSARPGGMGATFGNRLARRTVMWAGGVPMLLLAVAVWMQPEQAWRAVLGAVAAATTAWAICALARARIGGVTGDVLGAVVEMAELVLLVAFLLLLP